jgi:hypothetical protein
LVGIKVFGSHKRILIDTSVWIYHFEQHPTFAVPAIRVIPTWSDEWFALFRRIPMDRIDPIHLFHPLRGVDIEVDDH